MTINTRVFGAKNASYDAVSFDALKPELFQQRALTPYRVRRTLQGPEVIDEDQGRI